MRILLSFLSLLLATSASLGAAELVDLGKGLAYFRLEEPLSPATLRTMVAGYPGPLVIDLRHASDEQDAAAIELVWTASEPDAFLFALVSPATPPAIARALDNAPARLLILGAAGSNPAPDVVVRTDPTADRRAAEALAAGTSLDSLISGRIEKERFDEATLVNEFRNGNTGAEPPPPPDPTAAKTAAPASKALVAPVDRVLQRAIHLHRALLALSR